MVSRILVIVVTVLSVAFLGFAFVVMMGGPNWDATARSMMKKEWGYKFEFAPGPSAQWSATAPDGKAVGSSPILPSVIVSALDDANGKLQTKLTELKNREPQLREAQQTLDRQIATDKEALAGSVAGEEQRLAERRQQVTQLSNQIVQQTIEGTSVEQVVSHRRSDVFRLQNQLEVLRADEARIEQIHRQMADLIEQIDADLDKARRREEQLRRQLGQ